MLWTFRSDGVKSANVLWTTIFVLLLLSGSAAAQTASGDDPAQIIPGGIYERRIAGGQQAVYKVACAAGQLQRLKVIQRGIDVSIRIPGADGVPVWEFESDPRNDGEEPFAFVCPANQDVTVHVGPRQKDAKEGSITVAFTESVQATEKDKALDEAMRLQVSSTRLWRDVKYDQALPQAIRCLELRERELGPDHPDVGLALFTVANIYSEIPDLKTAEDYYRRAIANRSNALGAEHYSLASIYNNFGILFKEQGRYPEAATLYEKAIAIRERTLHPDHLLVASAINNLAGVLRARGDEEGAVEKYKRVLAIREKALGPDHPDVATSLNNVVDASWGIEKAEPYYLRALAIREAKLDPDHPDIAQTLYNLAALYAADSQYEKAEERCVRALAIFRKTLGDGHQLVTYPLNLLAVIAKGKGDFERSERLFEETVILKEKLEGPFHPNLGGSLTNLASLYAIRGKIEKAAAALERANRIFDYNIRLNLLSGSEKEKLKYVNFLSLIGDLTLTLNFDPKTRRAPLRRLAYETVLQRKGRVLDSISETMRYLRTSLSASDKDMLEAWNTSSERIAKLAVGGPGHLTTAQFKKALDDLEGERDAVERKISSKGRVLLEKYSTADPTTLAKALPVGTTLVEFSIYRPILKSQFDFAYSGQPAAGVLGGQRYAAFVVTRTGEVETYDLGERSAIDKDIELLKGSLRDPERKDTVLAARAVYRRIIAPIRAAIGGSERLLISPDGDLHLIPFETLVGTDGRFLVEKHSISYLSSGRDLLRVPVSTAAASPPVLVADPSFGFPRPIEAVARRGAATPGPTRGVTVATDLDETFFAPLSSTATEVNEIKELFPSARVLTGVTATESALKLVSSPQFLHIATHGFFVQNPVGGTKSTAGTRNFDLIGASGNPLLRSGLAFAGANERREAGDDGILTALEATGLHLDGVKLVVLSACDTGVGEIKAGEGVFGLRRAFQLAGAESLVMSLWPVDDYVTRELMSGYYKNLKAGSGRGESLRKVQLEMMKRPSRKHPFYWAGFIQAGEWANLDGKR